MSNIFNLNSGKPAFGVFSEPQTSGDYLYNKKSKTLFCNLNCNSIRDKKKISLNSENNLLYKRALQLSNINKTNKSDKTNLNINLITKMDLQNIPIIQDMSSKVTPSSINTTNIPYLTYNIDPSGILFGNTVCGLYNYEKFIVYDISFNNYFEDVDNNSDSNFDLYNYLENIDDISDINSEL
jgi:hypothetical protein